MPSAVPWPFASSATPRAPDQPGEHLEESPLPDVDLHLLRRILLVSNRTQDCEMLVTPSFGAGYSVFLERTSDSWFVVSRELRHSLPPDSFGSGDRPISPAAEEALLSKLRPLVKIGSNPLPDSTAQLLARVWSGMLRRRIRMNGWSVVDGQSYFFSRGGLDTGHISSPAPWTLPGRLVTLGESLILAAVQPAEAPPVLDRALRIVTDLAQGLARSVAS